MKNLDNSLNTENLDESFSNADAETTNPKAKSGVDYNALIALAAGLATTAIVAGTTPRGEEEVACGRPQPTWSSSRLDTHNKCVENFRTRGQSSSYSVDNTSNTNDSVTDNKFPWGWVVGITLGVVGLSIGGYFIFRNKNAVVAD